MVFTITAQNIGIMYYRTVQNPGGKYNVIVDGTITAELDGDFTDGWGDYTAYKEVFSSDKSERHTIEIIMSDKSKSCDFTVIGFCIS